MLWLISASLTWAFSFGLIKGLISGLDPLVMAAIRMVFAFAASLLFLKRNEAPISVTQRKGLACAGAIQLGLMYAPYMLSFQFLKAYEVALFTMTTPIFVIVIHQIAGRKWSWRGVAASLLAVAGGTLVAYKGVDSSHADLVAGLLLVQVANVMFACGQFLYARVASTSLRDQLRGMPFYFGGALLSAVVVAGCQILVSPTVLRPLTSQEWLVLLWLGVVASGLGFAVWNIGASKVSYGVLAVASDLKLPIAVLVSLVVFGERADLTRLIGGMVVLLVATALVRRGSC